MKTIVLTGSGGLLGQILHQGLESEYKVIGLDKKDADVSDFAVLKEFFTPLPKIDAVVHFAADAYPFAAWEKVVQHNIEGTKNVYECARIFNIPKVVFASSTHVVGSYPGYPHHIEGKKILHPDDPPRPDEFYGLSKAAGELIGRTYADLFKIQSINLRIGHTTGKTLRDPNLDKVELFEDDLIDLVKKSLEANIAYGLYFAVSDNPGRFLDLENAKTDLGYSPKKRS